MKHKEHIDCLIDDAIDAAKCISEEHPNRYDSVLEKRLLAVKKAITVMQKTYPVFFVCPKCSALLNREDTKVGE